MTKTPMPLLGRQPNARRCLTSRSRDTIERKRVETATTPTAKKYSLRDLVLDKEKIFMKLDKDIIIGNKTINGEQIFANGRNMEDIFQLKGTS
jgi:hypothetical protein